MIQADRADEGHIVEAPTMIRHGGTYVLFYSGNSYNSGRYFVNYATAGALCDQFVKHPGSCSTNTRSTTPTRIRAAKTWYTHGQDFLVFHAYTTPSAVPCWWRSWNGTTTTTQSLATAMNVSRTERDGCGPLKPFIYGLRDE